MRLIKMFGLAAAAAVAAMAFIGATSASAETSLCTAHDGLTCDTGQGATTLNLNNEGQGVSTLLTDIVNVLCLGVKKWSDMLGFLWWRDSHSDILLYTGCGTKAAHNNCELIVLEHPLGELKKTGLDTGTLTLSSGRILLLCDNIDIFGIDIHCVYDLTGLTYAYGAQHLTANDTAVNFEEGEFLCPEESFLDELLHTTENRYLLES